MIGIRDMLRSLKKSHVEELKIVDANLSEGQFGQTCTLCSFTTCFTHYSFNYVAQYIVLHR